MSCASHYDAEKNTLTLTLQGAIGFQDRVDFFKATAQINSLITTVIIDLQQTTDLDCAALSMLLTLRNYLRLQQQQLVVRVISPKPEISAKLNAIQFEQLVELP